MAISTRIQKISIDNVGGGSIRHIPVDWEVEVEGELKRGNVVRLKLGVHTFGFSIGAKVSSELEGTVITFDARIAFGPTQFDSFIRMYSVLPIPEGFRS